MKTFMDNLRSKVTCGVVGGSDFKKIAEQMGGTDSMWKFGYYEV